MEREHKQHISTTDNPNKDQNFVRDVLILREQLKATEDGEVDEKDVMDSLTHLRDFYKELGGYLLIPTAELLEQAMNYFNTHIDEIRETLAKYGVSGGTIDAVTQDYGGVMCAQYKFRATLTQMVELLKKVKPYRAYLADKYVLYYGVMMHYAKSVELAARFNDGFRVESATADTKSAFMNGKYSSTDAMCLLSLKNRGFFNVHDFEGIERDEVINWLDNLETFAHLGQYSVYYALATLVLGASTEQLQAIQVPELLHTLPNADTYADIYTENVRAKLGTMADKVAETYEAETIQEQTDAKREVEDWESKTNTENVRISNTMLSIMSRPVRSSDSEKARYTAPLTMRIQEYAAKRNIKGVSPYRINQVFECLNYMLRFGTPTNDGYIKINTTLSQFADECIGWDTNQAEKDEISAALGVLDGLFIVVPRPRKVEAIRLVVMKKITKTDAGVTELEIDVSALAAKGATQVIGAEEYRDIKKNCQSLSQSRFNSIIRLKNHQQESTLLDDVFGYSDEIETARMNKETEAQIKKRQENHRRHLARDKKKLEDMFKSAYKNGNIHGYIKRQTGTGKYNVPIFVYEWQRLKGSDTSTDDYQDADEQ